MKSLKSYDIDISTLGLGQYEFQYQIEDEFFELFDYSLIDHGSLSIQVVLEKKTSFLDLIFTIEGTIKLICDRSLDSYDFVLKTEKEIVLKFGEEAEELSDEVEIIPFNTQIINIARFIYEFISVEIPLKKLHPRYDNEPLEDQIIYSSEDAPASAEIDPRWSELKKLKHKK
jgi:uncharacterized metal-binding protein YceD (DUF177 family)